MDERTRSYIESKMDMVLEKSPSLPYVEWVQKEVPISSLRDLALGCDIGMLTSHAIVTVRFETGRCSLEDLSTIREMVKRRLPKIVEKIERELHR